MENKTISPIIWLISIRILHTKYDVCKDVLCTSFHSLPYTRKTIKYEKLFIVYFPFNKNEINFIESIKIFSGICQGGNEIPYASIWVSEKSRPLPPLLPTIFHKNPLTLTLIGWAHK